MFPVLLVAYSSPMKSKTGVFLTAFLFFFFDVDHLRAMGLHECGAFFSCGEFRATLRCSTWASHYGVLLQSLGFRGHWLQ